jgi:hypothetical protein
MILYLHIYSAGTPLWSESHEFQRFVFSEFHGNNFYFEIHPEKGLNLQKRIMILTEFREKNRWNIAGIRTIHAEFRPISGDLNTEYRPALYIILNAIQMCS